MSYRKRFNDLIAEGNLLLDENKGARVPPSIANWAAEACHLVTLIMGPDSTISQSANDALQKIKKYEHEKERRPELITEVIDLMNRTLEEDKIKPVIDPERLDEHLRLKIIDNVFKSWWVRSQMALVLITVIFLIFGIIKISSYEFNFDKTVQDSQNQVRNASAQILNEIIKKRAELETAIANSRADAQKVLNSLSEVENKADLLESKLRERLEDDRTMVLASIMKSIEGRWKPAIDLEVENQRNKIIDVAEKRARELSDEVAPKALAELGTIQENYGIIKAKHDELSMNIPKVEEDLKASVAQTKVSWDELEKKSKKLTNKLNEDFKDLSEDIGALRADLEILKAVDSKNGAFYWLIAASISSFLALIFAFAAFINSRKQKKRMVGGK